MVDIPSKTEALLMQCAREALNAKVTTAHLRVIEILRIFEVDPMGDDWLNHIGAAAVEQARRDLQAGRL